MNGSSQVRGGDALELGVDASLCYLFDGDGKAFHRPGKPLEQAA
jgi:hypothetical protein